MIIDDNMGEDKYLILGDVCGNVWLGYSNKRHILIYDLADDNFGSIPEDTVGTSGGFAKGLDLSFEDDNE